MMVEMRDIVDHVKVGLTGNPLTCKKPTNKNKQKQNKKHLETLTAGMLTPFESKHASAVLSSVFKVDLFAV